MRVCVSFSRRGFRFPRPHHHLGSMDQPIQFAVHTYTKHLFAGRVRPAEEPCRVQTGLCAVVSHAFGTRIDRDVCVCVCLEI